MTSSGKCICLPPSPPFDAVIHIACPVHAHLARDAILNADVVIQEQPPGRCELCEAVKETRPYGPNGEEVCFACAMKDEDAAKAAFDRRLAGESL